MIHTEKEFRVYFGDATDHIPVSFYYSLREKLGGRPEFSHIFKELNLDDLFFLHQVHGVAGAMVTQAQSSSMLSFANEGDFLITDQPHIGIGVMTADCVPIVIIDTRQKVSAVIHAGWRGAVAGIVPRVINELGAIYHSSLSDLRFFIGPSAKACCYQVGPDFMQHFTQYPYASNLVRSQNGASYFDVSVFIFHQILAMGVQSSAIEMRYNLCTICNSRFCSYRRGDNEYRQMTVVVVQ